MVIRDNCYTLNKCYNLGLTSPLLYFNFNLPLPSHREVYIAIRLMFYIPIFH